MRVASYLVLCVCVTLLCTAQKPVTQSGDKTPAPAATPSEKPADGSIPPVNPDPKAMAPDPTVLQKMDTGPSASSGTAPTPSTADEPMGLEALQAKIEGTSVPKADRKLTVAFKPAEDKPFQKEAAEMVGKYYRSLLDEDLLTTYDLMCGEYRKGVNVQNFLRKTRMSLRSVHITDIQFKGETCARAIGVMSGSAGNRLGNVDIPFKLRLFKEEGKWVVFTNPYQQMGFDLPQAKTMVYPCSFE